MMKESFLELLRSCESFQQEWDKLENKNKMMEEMVGCSNDLARTEADKDNLNMELVKVKAVLHSEAKNWEVDKVRVYYSRMQYFVIYFNSQTYYSLSSYGILFS